jgi:ABC-type protease/lipase transport system fused ATPase/permease subunit
LQLSEYKLEIIVIIAVLAFVFLAWLVWQLMRAKHFTQFKRQITQELKPKVIQAIINEMEETRSEQKPNTPAHQEATITYWSASAGRVLQAALMREIIDENWLKETGNLRNSQHLFHIEQDKLHR